MGEHVERAAGLDRRRQSEPWPYRHVGALFVAGVVTLYGLVASAIYVVVGLLA